MKLRVSFLLCCCIFFTVFFCACESEQVKQAKTAYKDGNYSEVVELLSKEENLSDSAQDMLTVSEANVMYENKEYMEAVKKLASSKDGVKAEQFEEMFNAALTDAIANKSPENVIELLKIDESKSDAVYEAVTRACNDKDYNGFVVLDGLVEKIEDGDLKTKLAAFSDEYTILRSEAFLVGTWERQNEELETNARVEIVPYNNNFIGKLVVVGDDQKQWHFQEGDIFMQDFEFEDAQSFLYTNLVRFVDGTPDKFPSSGTIDFKNGVITTKTTGTDNPDVSYKRIDE